MAVNQHIWPWDSQPQEVVRPHPQLPWTFLWNGATPGVNLATGQLAAASGLPVIGQGGRAQDFDASTTVQSFNIALPTTKYCFVVVSAFSKSDTAYRSIIRCNDYGFRYEPSTSFGGYYSSLTHTGVATTNNPAPHGASGFDLRPYVLIASYDGTVLTQYMRWPDGIIEIVTTTCGMSAGTGTLDISSSIGAMALYGAALMNAPLPDAVCREILARPWRYLAEPLQIPIPVSAGGGGATDLIIQEALHSHTADNIGLTLDTFLSVQEALHSHAADNLVLSVTGSTDLTVQETLHSHTADNLALTLDTFLLLQDALHAHAADNITLSTGAVADLVIQEALHAHTADNLTLSVSGTTTQTLADATLAATGTLAITTSGVLAVTLADATVTSTGTVALKAAVTQTLASATLSATGKVAIAGALAKTLADAGLVSTGALAIKATASQTLADATLVASGVLAVTGSGVLAQTLADAAVVAAGKVDLKAVVSKTLADTTLTSTGVLPIAGIAAQTLADATLSAQGTAQTVTTGSVTATLANATVTAAAKLAIAAYAAPTLADATLVATATAQYGDITGVVAQTLEAATCTATATVLIKGSSAITLGDCTIVASNVPTIFTDSDWWKYEIQVQDMRYSVPPQPMTFEIER